MSEQNQAIATRFFAELCNGRNLGVADELFAAGHIYDDPAYPGVGSGPQGMKEFLSTFHRAYPDAHWTIDEMLAVEGAVITRWTGRGTQSGELPGIPPTGRTAVVQGVWIHRIVDGKIAQSFNVWDTLGMLRQLGAIPAIAQAA
ncbi:MAG TPA: ester cyclase [Bryobacteraceae bacterium]|nr:ester cyclase [Bryobacteraceae bacterium]